VRFWQLATDAADAVGTHDVDQVANVLNAGHMPDGFLNELLKVKRRQLAGEDQRAASVFDEDVADSAAEMWMMF
jgi:hypothetical protein